MTITTQEVIADLFNVQTNLKFYHWNTKSFSRHKAADELHEQLQNLGDSLVETMIIRYGRPTHLSKKQSSLSLTTLSDDSILTFLQSYAKTLTHYKFEKAHTDLESIRDELLATVNKTLYVMSLQ